MDEWITINLGRGREQDSRAFVLGQAERLMRAERTDLQRLDRQLGIIDGAGRRSEMPDEIHRATQINKFGNILANEPEIRIPSEMRDVIHAAGDQIVDGDDAVAAREKQINQMRSQKAGAAGHH